MTVLRSGISALTRVIPVDAPLSNPSYPIFYDIDSETIKVIDGADTTEWQVDRGIGDTQQARHAKSVRLVANANPYGGGGGGATVPDPSGAPDGQTVQTLTGAYVLGSPGGVQTVSLIGPFSVDFDDVDIGNGIGLADLETGQLVVLAWPVITTAFQNGVDPTWLAINIGNPAGSTVTIGYYHADGGQDLPSVAAVSATVNEGDTFNDIVTNLPRQAFIVADTQIVAYIDGGPCTQGHADIYALIATPA